MTIDKSLKISRGSLQNRNVLTRVERLKQLAEEERWNNGDSPFGLPKVRVAKVSLGRVKKVKDEVDEGLAQETAEPEEE
ncbi:MAG: small basic protein [Planctomycetaceae bacterium]|nr:small basic protein [Planctomycetaceae bacterium]